MDQSKFHVITTSFNIKRWMSHHINMKSFIDHMKSFGVNLWIAETVFGDHDFEYKGYPGVNHVGFSTRSPVWAKERSINLTIQRLPSDWKYVAWIDGDIEFRNPGWVDGTLDALQHYDWVWPWEYCYDLGPHGDHMELHHSFGRQWLKDPVTCEKMGKGYTFAHPGYAMATTRATLEKVGGLIDTAVLGASDHHTALAMVGKAERSFPGYISEGYRKPILQWQDRAEKHINGNFGYVPGTIAHQYHGPKGKAKGEGRDYIGRWDILKEHAFDPSTDLKVNTTGMWELSGNKSKLKRDLMAYYANRQEDTTTLGAAYRSLGK